MAAAAAICGRLCAITVGGSTYGGHQWTLNQVGREIDITSFGSSKYGDWKVCFADGTVSAQFYERPNVSPDDIVTLVLTLGSTPNVTLTAASTKIIGVTTDVDAKGLVGFTVNMRITVEPTVGS
jgi:hypothetical protein